jgi:hypothetical protein
VRKLLRHWQEDGDLSGVREPAALAALPAGEGKAWRRLWADVEALAGSARRKE